MARENAATDMVCARKLKRASYVVSSVGVFVTVIIIIFLVVMMNTQWQWFDCSYEYDGVCYRHYSVMSGEECAAIGGVYDGDWGCYYN